MSKFSFTYDYSQLERDPMQIKDFKANQNLSKFFVTIHVDELEGEKDFLIHRTIAQIHALYHFLRRQDQQFLFPNFPKV